MKRKHVVRVFRVKMSEKMSKKLNEMIEEGVYVTYADAIRHAIALLVKEKEAK